MTGNRRLAILASISLLAGIIQSVDSEKAEATTGCSNNSGSTSITESGNLRIRTFTVASNGTDATCTWTVPDNVFVVDYLVVAGGGGGGSGGGGGGGVVTSWGASDLNPQTVTPGSDISIVVGRGGSGGSGGSGRYNGTAGTAHQTQPTSGGDSKLGDITAKGGGAGGSNGVGQQGGSSGGDSYDRNTTSGSTATQATVVGAAAYGNDGGGSPGGSYSSGGGGGGAGGSGGNARIPGGSCINGSTTGSYGENCTSHYLAGGNGGSGRSLDISGSNVQYGCGGGGGVNANSNAVVTNGAGAAGCSNAGRGSSYGNYYTNYTATTATNNANATSGTSGTGGGGGGTDPEDTRGAAGGSGIVILRYTLVDSACPNDGSNTASEPLACPTNLTVQANGNAFSVSVRGNPISFASASATISVRSSPSGMATSVSGGSISVTVASGSSLIGGTYPVVYRITQNSATSDSYVLVTVEDPAQLTPGTIPLDPRNGTVTLPKIELGESPNVLVCMTFQDDGLTFSASSISGVTQENPTTRRITFRGTRSSVQSAVETISISAATNQVLVPSGTTRSIDVNVSNTNNGGNGSCAVGTSSSITLRKLSLKGSDSRQITID